MVALENFFSGDLIKRYSKNIHGRDYVVGDIHGEFKKLLNQLIEIQFDFEKDRLFSVGDLVDRGRQSEEVLDWLSKKWFFSVKGNHELFLHLWMTGELDDITYHINGGEWAMYASYENNQLYHSAFSRLPVAIEVETEFGLVGIVHADCPFPSWDVFKACLIGGEKSEIAYLLQEILFSRSRIEEEVIEYISGISQLYVGHTTVKKIITLGNVIYLDTGGWKDKEGSKFSIIQI